MKLTTGLSSVDQRGSDRDYDYSPERSLSDMLYGRGSLSPEELKAAIAGLSVDRSSVDG